MLSREEDIDAHALARQGWTISAIARHLGRDRKTIRAYLRGDRVAGVRKPAGEDAFEPFVDYVRARLSEDPHLWAATLYDEVVDLGYDKAYSTFTRQVRTRGLRPHCEPCAGTKGRPAAVIEHPPGEETQWDWVELPDPPEHWGWGTTAYLLVGALAHSGRWRGALCPSMDQAHLIDALDRTTRALGGLPRSWRFDRMATVCHPGTGRVSASFAAVAKHYGVHVEICPPRRGNRKGVVEKANHTAAQRWWRTLPDDLTAEQAQASLDKFCSTRGDARLRPAGPGGKASVLTLAEREPLAPVPTIPFPATISQERTVSAQALLRRPHPAHHRRAGLPTAARRGRLRAVPGRLPALPQNQHHPDHQPRGRLLGRGPGRHHRRRRDARPAPAPLRRAQPRGRLLPPPRPPRPPGNPASRHPPTPTLTTAQGGEIR